MDSADATSKPLVTLADDQRALRLSSGISRGDRSSFAEFYEVWFERSVEIVRAATGKDESFALDVTQDAMLRAARAMPTIASQRELDMWMGRVLYTAALDRIKAERRRAARERAVLRNEEASGGEGDVGELIIALGGSEQELLWMRFARGMQLDEIAAAVDTTAGSVSGRIRRAIMTLRGQMEREP